MDTNCKKKEKDKGKKVNITQMWTTDDLTPRALSLCRCLYLEI